jgi:SRSO17 transposase
VGVTRQYPATLGKTDNCQVAVSLHYAAPNGDYPWALRLFRQSPTSQPDRMEAARVPLEHKTQRTKNQIALDLLDQMHAEGLPYRAAVAEPVSTSADNPGTHRGTGPPEPAGLPL